MEITVVIILVLQAFAFGFFTQVLASAKGYSQKEFFWIGFFFSFLGLIFVHGLPSKTEQARPPARPPPLPLEERVDIYISMNGRAIGPYAARQITDLLAAGALRPDTMFWKEGMTDWKPLSTL